MPRSTPPPPRFRPIPPPVQALSSSPDPPADDALAAAFALLDEDSDSRLAAPELELLLASLDADVDAPAVLKIADADQSGSLDLSELRRALAANAFHREETGRYRVALSLAEAEAVRALLHAARDAELEGDESEGAALGSAELGGARLGSDERPSRAHGASKPGHAGRKQHGVVPGTRAAVALMAGPDGPIIDAEGGWRPAGAAQGAAAGAALRFFNSGAPGLDCAYGGPHHSNSHPRGMSDFKALNSFIEI